MYATTADSAKPTPSAMASVETSISGPEISSKIRLPDEPQTQADDGQHDARLDRPEDAADRRANRAGCCIQRNRRRLQKVLGRGCLDVGEEIFVRRQPLEQLRVRVGLGLRGAQPPAVLDDETRRASRPSRRRR